MASLYRVSPDSSGLGTPRVFVRSFCRADEVTDRVAFYRELTGQPVDLDLAMPEAELHVVAVGTFLIVALDPDRHPDAARTTATMLVADLDDAVAAAVAGGAEVIQSRRASPVGAGARLRHPDGLVVEYVEHRPGPHDVPVPNYDW